MRSNTAKFHKISRKHSLTLNSDAGARLVLHQIQTARQVHHLKAVAARLRVQIERKADVEHGRWRRLVLPLPAEARVAGRAHRVNGRIRRGDYNAAAAAAAAMGAAGERAEAADRTLLAAG
jgi:hypothetical protein